MRKSAALFALLVVSSTLLFAAGGKDVQLTFTQSDKLYLFASLGMGLVALIFGFAIMRMILALPRGSDRMQEVGDAIMSGAKGYLRQQIKMMSLFVLLLGIGLFFMYWGDFGFAIAFYIALSFIGGVAASYTAGYVGMMMAVNANTRTAHAALTSFKGALETAFRAGSVAGLITVGMGLIGATLIFLLAGADAMKLLIGFGFGGSLAALFMRVGGGIYTKAADVGADLVGKVEAGIPEDDPRNPATIADNVGDNVGDCAGMAADVFESYEVTLVAAIVLGAATATIFDQQTWMKLVLFALMARGVGIIASIIGIFAVKGPENIDIDPLISIRRGFIASAVIAGIATIGLAYLMMGGGTSQLIQTNQFTTQQQSLAMEYGAIWERRDAVAQREGIDIDDVSISQVISEISQNPIGGFPEMEDEKEALVGQALATSPDDIDAGRGLSGYQPIDWTDEEGVATWATMAPRPMTPEDPLPANPYVSLRERYEDEELLVYKLKLVQSPPPLTEDEEEFMPPQPEVDREIQYGPIPRSEAEQLFEQAQMQGGMSIETLATYPATLFADSDGNLAVAIAADHGEVPLYRLATDAPVTYYKMTPEELENRMQVADQDPSTPLPRAFQAEIALVQNITVPWYKFALCILFGIIMAFIFELLTDYYVSLHKRPVRETTEVATAGPAPMIITGFAYGKESSVFSLLAIVACLILPLLVFPVTVYGGYLLSFYGIALVGLGLLTTTGYILAMDTFGPISDNAQGVFEMSGAGEENPEAAVGVQRLDAAGNTTKALTKGFAIATAVVAAVALFHAFVESANLSLVGMPLDIPEIFLGLLIGGAVPFLFCAFAIHAVGRASFQLINEVRRQFRDDPGIMKGTSKPNYDRCVSIVTAAAQKELLGPGILAIAFPVLVGFGFAIGKPTVNIAGGMYNLTGAQALGGFLAGTILSGQLLAVMLANSGGLWDNCKKLVEDGMHGGKGTEAHKAAVVCDTVGDPFKDTAGPALNPLIKVMNLVALLLAPFVILPLSTLTQSIIAGIAAASLVVAVVFSKRGSMSSELVKAQKEANAGELGTPELSAEEADLPIESPKTHDAEFAEESDEFTDEPEDEGKS